MSRAKVFSFIKMSESSSVASVRIAQFVGKMLDMPIYQDETVAEGPLDILVIVNGAYSFAGTSLLAALGQAIERAKRVVWIQNDYTIIPPKDEGNAESPFRKAFRNRKMTGKSPADYWTTVQMMSRPGVSSSGHNCGSASAYVNWNALTMIDMPIKTMSERVSPNHMVYFGVFRKDREKYFERYFRAPHVPTIISCNNQKFSNEFDHPLITHETKLFDLYRYISECGMGLYLEDKRSHKEFHSPGNRFYEMLSAGVPMVFQPEAMKMMEKAGYDLQDWIIWKAADAPALMERKEEILRDQQAAWYQKAIAEREALPTTLKTLWTRTLETL